jgi:hypothetical protein
VLNLGTTVTEAAPALEEGAESQDRGVIEPPG